MKKLLLVAFLLASCSHKRKEPPPPPEVRVPTHTIYVQFIGWKKAGDLQDLVMNHLQEKPCFKLKDVSATSAASTDEACKEFREFDGEDKVQGDCSAAGGTCLYKITLLEMQEGQKISFNIQAYERDRSRLRRFFNPGTFSLPGEDSKPGAALDAQAADLIKGITFK